MKTRNSSLTFGNGINTLVAALVVLTFSLSTTGKYGPLIQKFAELCDVFDATPNKIK